MKFLKSVRFDPSDTHVYARAAEPEEWVISGAFAFHGAGPDDLIGKDRQAFANGFLSLDSFGRSTFASVTGLTQALRAELTAKLARHLVADYGAPTLVAAQAAAEEEIAFTADTCADLPFGAVLAVRRSFDDTGAIREAFHVVDAGADCHHHRAWDVIED